MALSPKIAKSRQEIETHLLEILQKRQSEWACASEDNRDAARQRFTNALNVFNSLVLYGKPPTDGWWSTGENRRMGQDQFFRDFEKA
jgi:hypothetical protein